MRLELVNRSVVFVTVAMTSESLNLQEFEDALGLDRPVSQVSTPPVLLADYQRLRLVAQGGQVQLELKPNAGRDLVRRSATEIIRQVRLHTTFAVGFNAAFRINTSEGEDLFAAVLRTDAIAERLGVDTFRPGLKASYPSEDSVDTLTIDPEMSDDDVWIGQLNRHHSRPPDPAATERAVSWLGAANDEVEALIRRVLRSADD